MLNRLIKTTEAITTAVLNRFVSFDHNIDSSHRPWIDARNFASLSAAIDACGAAGSKPCTIAITNNQAVSSNKTVLPHITLWFANSGRITFSGGAILTVQGGMLEMGLQQRFFGTGTVVFDTGFIERVYPQWWGAKGDGVTDDDTAILASIASVVDGLPVFFSPGTFIFDTLDLPEKCTMIGSGSNLTTLKRKAAGSGGVAFDSTANADNIVLKDFTLDCNSEGTNGIDLGNGTGTWGEQGLIDNVPVINCPGTDYVVDSDGGEIKGLVEFAVNKNSTPQTVTSGAGGELLEWELVERDVHGFFDLSIERWIPKIPGRYLLSVTIYMAVGSSDQLIDLFIKKNGALYRQKEARTNGSNAESVSLDVQVDANGTTDYFEAWVSQVSGSDRQVSGSTVFTWFQGHLIN